MAVDLDPRQKRNRTRSPAYPYIPLPAALEKAAVLWQIEGRHAAAVNVAMQHWGYKEESSTGYSCVAALKKFGLVDHEGMGENRQVRLSGLALSILLDKNPDSPERRDALRAAALGPRIHAELWERYGTELPSDQSLKRFLVVERAFNEAAVDELLDEYKVTMAFAGLPVGAGGTEVPARPPVAGLPPAALSAPVTVRAAEPRNAPEPTLSVVTGGPGHRDGTDRRLEASPNAARPPTRSSGSSNGTSYAGTVSGAAARLGQLAGVRAAQQHLFDEEEASEVAPGPGVYEEMLPPVGTSRPRDEAPREAGTPWSTGRRELPVPLDNGMVATVPYPMTEEDFLLLIDTLQLWKKRLVHPSR